MGDRTEIAWTDASWNPWIGCRKVSEACANCYFYGDSKRYGFDPMVVRRSKTTFNDPLKWAKNREKYGHINRVFTCSWSDFFIEEADAWRTEAWDVIRRTPELTYQILTKRPERIADCLPDDWGVKYRHVLLGTTTENKQRFNERTVHWPVQFVSVEPMLGPMDGIDLTATDWVICGCESGPNARETKIEWVRSLRDQCIAARIPFFLKQLMIDGKLVTTPELDGRRWTEFPR